MRQIAFVQLKNRQIDRWQQSRERREKAPVALIKSHDYLDVDATTGKRFWIFRVLPSGRWLVHGYFE